MKSSAVGFSVVSLVASLRSRATNAALATKATRDQKDSWPVAEDDFCIFLPFFIIGWDGIDLQII